MKAMSVAEVLYSIRFSAPVELPLVALFEMRSVASEVSRLCATGGWCGHGCFAVVTLGMPGDEIGPRRIASITVAAECQPIYISVLFVTTELLLLTDELQGHRLQIFGTSGSPECFGVALKA